MKRAATAPRRILPTVVVAIALLLPACQASPGAKESLSVTATGAPSPSVSVPASVALGAAAWSTKAGFEGLWVQVDPPVDQMVKIDLATGNVAMGIDGGAGVAFTDDAVWVALPGEAEIRKLDPLSGETLLSASAESAYLAAGAGSVWAVGSDGSILRLDPASGELLASIPIEAREVTEIAVDNDAAWVTAKADGKVFRIDPTTNEVVAEIETGTGAHGIVIDSSGVWVSNYRANTVSRIDAATNAVVATVAGVGSGVGITAADGAIWVSTRGEGISRIDPATNMAELVVELAEWNYGIAFADGELWISSVNQQLVYRVSMRE